MNKILDVVEALDARSKIGDHFFVTAVDVEGVATFFHGRDVLPMLDKQ